MRFGTNAFLVLSLALSGLQAADATTLTGSSLALKSDGQSSGGTYVLDRNGFVGTYITLAAPASVKIDVAAEGAGGAAMGIAVADATASFSVATGANTYSHTFSLPAGTHFIRTELNNAGDVAGRQLKVNSLTVTGTGVSFSNTNNSANALAASDTYIANYRKVNATVKIQGVSAGQQVTVSLKRLAFDFGAGVHGGMLNNHPTAGDARYQAKVLENFNTVTTAGSGMWYNNEPTRGDVSMVDSNSLQEYAADHGLRTRLHTMLFEYGDPPWVKSLKADAAGGNATARASLDSAIAARNNYFVGNAPHPFDQIDLYNESYSNGEQGDNDTYWNLYRPDGIAEIYHQAQVTAASAGYAPKLFVNDGDALQTAQGATGYIKNIKQLRAAAAARGYGEVVGGVGLQFYESSLRSDLAPRFVANLAALNELGLPLVLTEFGTFSGVSDNDSATILDQSMRLMFGNANSTGFIVWDWTKEDGGVGQWAPNAALYNVGGSSFDTWTITPAGKIWQDKLGIQDWDGNPSNGWNTQLTATVGAGGTINFDGFYGDYQLTVGGKTYDLSLTKGTTNYVVANAIQLPGDFNGNGRVDTADYIVWRDHLGTNFALSGNGNESGASAGVVDRADYAYWKARFGTSAGSASITGVPLPEPAAFSLAMPAAVIIGSWSKRQRPRSRFFLPLDQPAPSDLQ